MRIPKYRRHKASGQAVVTLSGRDHYLGVYDSAESHEAYSRIVQEWLAGGCAEVVRAAPDLTVLELIAAYWSHVLDYYVKDGRPTSQQANTRAALGPVRELYGHTRARDFGPLALVACRDWMVQRGWCRLVVNQRTDAVRRMFRWAVGRELLPAAVHNALAAVEGLKKGRTTAPESEDVRPADEAAITAVLGLVTTDLADAIRLQLLTAMRPGEVLALQAPLIDRTSDVWLYAVAGGGKTAHTGHVRSVLIGPRGQELLRPRLLKAPEGWLFSPAGRNRRYHHTSYVKAIGRACRQAGALPWTPNQLRHNAGTRLREEFGIEVARIILGHQDIATTEIYAEAEMKKALEAIRKVG